MLVNVLSHAKSLSAATHRGPLKIIMFDIFESTFIR